MKPYTIPQNRWYDSHSGLCYMVHTTEQSKTVTRFRPFISLLEWRISFCGAIKKPRKKEENNLLYQLNTTLQCETVRSDSIAV